MKRMMQWLLILVLSFPTLIFADETKSETPYGMEEVFVTAGRVEEAKNDVTANATVIDEETIRKSHAGNLGEILKEQVGIYIKEYPGALTSIGIRGFRTETHGNDLQGHVLVLLNGRRAGTGNAAKILTGNIERIEIIRGPAAVQYGSGAMGGLVNVITKRGTEDYDFSISTGFGSYGENNVSASASGKAGGFDIAASITRKTADDYKTGNGETFHNTGIDNSLGLCLNAGLELVEKQRIGVTISHFDATGIGNPGYITKNDLDDYKNSSNTSLEIAYEGKSSTDNYTWQAKMFTGKDEDSWWDPAESDPNEYYDDGIPFVSETSSKGFNAQFSANLWKTTLTSGIDWIEYKQLSTSEESEYSNLAGYLLAKALLFDDRLVVSAGLRNDNYDVKIINPSGNRETASSICPSIGIAYHINDLINIRANAARGFKMPSAKELGADYESRGTRYVGNPDLDPETSNTYEMGIDLHYRHLNASLTYFHTDFDDKIISFSTPGGDSSWTNLGSARISGFESELAYTFNFSTADLAISPYYNMTYLYEYKDDESGDDLLYTPDLTASFGIRLSGFGNRFHTDLNASYMGKQMITDYQFGSWPDYPTVEMDDVFIVNLAAEYAFYTSENNGNLSLQANVRNLLDENYAYVQGYPMPGINFYLGLRYTL